MVSRWTPSRRCAGRGLLVLTAVWGVVAAVPVAAQAPADRQVTFTKDIAPILQRSCQQCHRPDSIAPMSLLTYEQARPYAREIKRRTALRDSYGARGAMPPWFIEKNIGIQKFKEDISLSDEEIAKIAKWADGGAPEGNPADMPPPLKFAENDNSRWWVGKPDLIVSSPTVLVKGVSPDWWGDFGETPTGVTEDRYARSVEYKELSDLKVLRRAPGYVATKSASPGQGKTALVVFHHATASVRRPNQDGSNVDGEAGGGGLSLHEVGRNGDIFPADAGKLVSAGSVLSFNGHIHSPGVPGADRNAHLDVGLRFHPKGYKPKFREGSIQLGSTELEIRPDSDYQRYDGYWVAPQPVKLLNFEPHLHATGMRMCIEVIYQRSIETLNCAGYDHNWVRNYQYDENAAPLLPKGTILHLISWFDGTAKNANNIEPRNTTVWGRRSVANMYGVFNKAFFLTDEQYQEELAKRREYLQVSGEDIIGCPGCYEKPAPKTVAEK